jgi:hypothetical protein
MNILSAIYFTQAAVGIGLTIAVAWYFRPPPAA